MSWLRDEYMRVMVKHLPPSAATLQLLDIGGVADPIVPELRPDVSVKIASLDPTQWTYDSEQFDAVLAYDLFPNGTLLSAILKVLRPGGRFMLVNPLWGVEQRHVQRLEQIGYVRILVEEALEGSGLLMRGEKAHITDDTLQRVRDVAQQDGDLLTLSDFRGRYVHLLVRQLPNKPVWKLTPDEQIEWWAVAVERGNSTRLLAFSSLPKAVAFMQPAVMAQFVQDVNKVGKFSKSTASLWPHDILLNPTLAQVEGDTVIWIPVDPDTAEAPDE